MNPNAEELSGAHAPARSVQWTLRLAYLTLVGWLAWRSRVFMDEIWLIEWGRVLCDPATPWSMYMFADGSSMKPLAMLGPALAEWAFRVGGSVFAFRLVGVASMLLLAWSVQCLAARRGVDPRAAWLLSLALMLDPTMLQSVVLGRPDALGLALGIGGLALADGGVARVIASGHGWWRVALGYGACALAPSVWSSAALLGPLIAAHWLASAVSLHRQSRSGGLSIIAFAAVPLATLWASTDFSHVWAVSQAHAGDPLFTASTSIDAWRRIPGLITVSALLVLPGVIALPLLRPRWAALVLGSGMLLILSSGFYPFRIPFLLVYCAAAMILCLARIGDPARLQGWLRYLGLVVLVGGALLVLRVGFALVNQPRILPGATWLAGLPPGTRVADYSWDFYESARLLGHQPVRSYPGDRGERVLAWLRLARPDVVVRAVDATGSFVLVDDIDAKLAAAGYCPDAWIDVRGQTVDPAMRPRPVPTALLWRLGLYRDHGPYATWRPCGRG